MAMTERAFSAHAYEEAQSFEQRRLRVLDGTAAKEKLNARRADAIKIGLTVVAVMLYLLSLTMMEAKIGNMVSRINGIQREIDNTVNASLRSDLEIGELSSLGRIEAYAVTKLGMVSPGVDNIHYLNGESSQLILSGQQNLTEREAVIAEEAEEELEPTFWQSLATLFQSYWRGESLAVNDQ